MDPVDKLYQSCEILANAKDSIADHESEYMHILDAVKGGPQEKVLASQFIPRFVKSFSQLADCALERMFDLVEDEDPIIRKQAIKNLPSICKDLSDYASKISDILTQLLICEDSSEITLVHTALITIMKIDVQGALTGIFSQIATTEEEIVRKRAINYMCAKLKLLSSDLITKEIEEFIVKESNKLFSKVTGEEFATLMSMLGSLKISKTIPGQKALLQVILDQMELEKEFSCNLPNVLCLLQCLRSAMIFFSTFNSSAPVVKYICTSVVPHFKELSTLDDTVDFSIEIMKLLAEISPFCTNMLEADNCTCLKIVCETLLEYIHLPPVEGLDGADALAVEPNFQYTQIECLMFTFYQLAKRNKEYVTSEKNAEFFKDFKLRLNYLARVNQGGIKKIRESLIENKADKSKNIEENKIKAVALRTMSNINTLIKDLFHTPPLFKASLILSWKPATEASAVEKRPREEITFDDADKKLARKDWKGSRQLYSPPSGKFSSNVKFGRFNSPRYYRGRGRGYF